MTLKIFIPIVNVPAITIILIISNCSSSNEKPNPLKLFQEYHRALKDDRKIKWNYTTDTVKLWFDDRKGNPVLQIKGKRSTGVWKEWDEVMNSSSYYDSIWYDTAEHAVKGYFYENNDFYVLIGKPPTQTLRTYWLTENNKIKEILIYWIPEENTLTTEYLKPIVEWAMKYDSVEIKHLYPEGKLIPSRENAIRWKKLLKRYHETDTTGSKKSIR